MAQLFVSGMAHFFVVVSGSKIHERVAHFFIDIYKIEAAVKRVLSRFPTRTARTFMEIFSRKFCLTSCPVYSII